MGEKRPEADRASSEGPPEKEKSREFLAAERLDLGTWRVWRWVSLGLSDGGARSGMLPKDAPGDRAEGEAKRGRD